MTLTRHTFYIKGLGERTHRCARCNHPTPTMRERQAHAALLRHPHVEVTQ